MAGRDGRYPNTKVGFEQSKDNRQMERLFVDSDGYFNFGSQDVSGDQLRNALYVPLIVQRPINSTLTTSYADSQKNLISGVGTVIFSTTSNHTNMSFWLTSCVLGREVVLMVRPGSATGASGIIWISTSGCSLVGLISASNISGFFMRGSSNSMPVVWLKALQDDQWSVMSGANGYAEA